MIKQATAALVAAIVCASALVTPADARRCCKRSDAQLYNSSNGGVRQYRASACGYGDCACLRGYAISTGAQVWWDRYQACTGR